MRNFLIWSYLKRIKKLDTPSKIIGFAFQRHARRTCLYQPDKNIQYSFYELEQRVKKLIHFFSMKLLKSGDVVAFLSANSFEYFEIRAAAHMSGLIFFAMPRHLSPAERAYFLQTAGAKLLFYRDTSAEEIHIIQKRAGVEHCINLEGPEYAAIFKEIAFGDNLTVRFSVVRKVFDTFLHHEKDIFYRKVPAQVGDIATLNVSSGTTQKAPKIVQLSATNWVESLYNYVLNADMPPHQQTVFLCTLPFATAGSTTFLPSMLAGITTIVMEGDFSAQKTEAFINQCKVTRLYITPSWLIELLLWCKENNEHLSSLENIIIGTERASPATLKEAIAFFGPKITVGYGMVEVLPPISMLSRGDYFCQGQVRDRHLASVGRVLRGAVVKIVDDNGDDVFGSAPGRITIHSKTIGSGYLENREATARHFKDGWFFSDDSGFMDKDGFLYVLGRASELLVKTGQGRPIFVRELEDTIYELDCIRHCCATPNRNRNVVLFVSLRPRCAMDKDAAHAKIIAYCDEHVDDNLMPLKVVIKDALPITPLGKLDRQRLAKEANE